MVCLTKGGYVNGPLSNDAYTESDGGDIRGIQQSLATGKRQDMSKGPLGLLNLFVKGIDSLTGYDRDNEVRADLPKAKENMFINKRRNPYTGEYPITEEEYQRVMGKEPVNLSMGGMTNPLSKVRYKQSGGLSMKRLKYPTVDLYLKEFNYGNTISAKL